MTILIYYMLEKDRLSKLFGFKSTNDLIMVGPGTTKIGCLLEDLAKNAGSIDNLDKWNIYPMTFRWMYGMQIGNTELYKFLTQYDNVQRNAKYLIYIFSN